jgi:hypothetical protein
MFQVDDIYYEAGHAHSPGGVTLVLASDSLGCGGGGFPLVTVRSST